MERPLPEIAAVRPRAALEAFLDVCQVEGGASVEPRRGGAVFELRWRASAPAAPSGDGAP